MRGGESKEPASQPCEGGRRAGGFDVPSPFWLFFSSPFWLGVVKYGVSALLPSRDAHLSGMLQTILSSYSFPNNNCHKFAML